MTTMRIGIADYESMKKRTMKIARGELRRSEGEPKVWFTSVEAMDKALSSGNPELLKAIVESSQ